jgi:hypothetical protein
MVALEWQERLRGSAMRGDVRDDDDDDDECDDDDDDGGDDDGDSDGGDCAGDDGDVMMETREVESAPVVVVVALGWWGWSRGYAMRADARDVDGGVGGSMTMMMVMMVMMTMMMMFGGWRWGVSLIGATERW